MFRDFFEAKRMCEHDFDRVSENYFSFNVSTAQPPSIGESLDPTDS